jgi:hypothetical protein
MTDRRIVILTTGEEYQEIKAAADRDDRPLSASIRRAILKMVRSEK